MVNSLRTYKIRNKNKFKYPRCKIKLLEEIGEMNSIEFKYRFNHRKRRKSCLLRSYEKMTYKLVNSQIGKSFGELEFKFRKLIKDLEINFLIKNSSTKDVLFKLVNTSRVNDVYRYERFLYHYYVDVGGILRESNPNFKRSRESWGISSADVWTEENLLRVTKQYRKRGKPIFLGNCGDLKFIYGLSYMHHVRPLRPEDIFPIYVIKFWDYWARRHDNEWNMLHFSYMLGVGYGLGFSFNKRENRHVYETSTYQATYIYITPKKFIEKWRLRKKN